jgi:hypothetical protein
VSEIHLAEVERDSLPDELDFYETRVADKVLRDAVESIWQSWCWFIALIETTKSEKKTFATSLASVELVMSEEIAGDKQRADSDGTCSAEHHASTCCAILSITSQVASETLSLMSFPLRRRR